MEGKKKMTVVGICRTRGLAVGDESREVIMHTGEGKPFCSTTKTLGCHHVKEKADSKQESNVVRFAC